MVKFEKIIAATIAASNMSEEDRMYDITAEVETKSGKATNVSSGIVKVAGEEKAIATFSGWNETHLNLNMKNVPYEKQEEVFAAVRAFVKQLRENANKLDLTANCI